MGVMRVPQFTGGGRIIFGTRPRPEPGDGQLLIAVKANALCGSERGQFLNGSAVTPGHETVGVVAAAGPGTTTPVGTPGAIFLMDFCGTCRSCRAGHTNQCEAKRGDIGFSHDGGYGPLELVHENIFFPIGSDLAPVEATLLLDIMGTGGHALGRARRVRPDIESLLVMGAGPIGLGVLAMARVLFPREMPIHIADFSKYRLDLARQLGGSTIDLSVRDANRMLSDVPAPDIAVDTSGKAAARQAALDSLGKRGVLVCVGHGEGLSLEVSPQLIAPERSVLGSEYFAFSELADNLKLLREHRAYFNQIITHRFGVEDLQQAFELFFRGETGKVVIEQ
jgi:threonine 3-dehydrogenase